MEDEINGKWEWTSEVRHFCISLLLLVWFGLISGRDIDVVVVVGGFTLIEHKTNVCVPIQDRNTIWCLMFWLINPNSQPTPKNANPTSSWCWDSVVVVRSRSTMPKEPTKVFELTHSLTRERDGSSSWRKMSDFNNAAWSWWLLLVAALWEISSSHCVPRDTLRETRWELETEGREWSLSLKQATLKLEQDIDR